MDLWGNFGTLTTGTASPTFSLLCIEEPMEAS
jgi:hypothetical protein